MIRDVMVFYETAAASFPWQTAPTSPTPCRGSITHRRERPGPAGDLVPAGGIQPRAARRRSPASSTATTAATAASSHAAPSRLAAARVAHLPAERVGNEGDALSPALAQLSPQPSRLTPRTPDPRPGDPAHQGQDRLARTGVRGSRSDAARIAAPRSAPATPGTCREGRGRSTAPRNATAGVLATGLSSRDLYSELFAVSAHGVGTAAPVGSHAPAGPIEQCTSRKAGRVPLAGTTTQGAE